MLSGRAQVDTLTTTATVTHWALRATRTVVVDVGIEIGALEVCHDQPGLLHHLRLSGA